MKLQRLQVALRSNLRAAFARPYHHLLIASDAAGWVLDEEAKEMIRLAGTLGFPAYFADFPRAGLRQCVHYTSFFSLANPKVFSTRHRISADYFHGKPNQDPAFKQVFDSLRLHAGQITKLRLSYSGMLPYAREAGIPENKIHLIPIGINPTLFSPQNAASRREARERLGIPLAAFVVGSFQKDGEGWGEGLKPKLIKGPDVFLRALEILKPKVPELQVLLTGPARGFVKAGLDRLGIPYKHFMLERYSEVGSYYQALDAYMIASREEGGPKAILESQCSGIPLLSTRVGQAIDLVKQGENGLLTEVEDSEALANGLLRLHGDSALRGSLASRGLISAQEQTYDAQLPLWRSFFADYVDP